MVFIFSRGRAIIEFCSSLQFNGKTKAIEFRTGRTLGQELASLEMLISKLSRIAAQPMIIIIWPRDKKYSCGG